jgi:hypothetical protein
MILEDIMAWNKPATEKQMSLTSLTYIIQKKSQTQKQSRRVATRVSEGGKMRKCWSKVRNFQL